MIDGPVERGLRDRLYAEAMLLADEARDYFDGAGRIESAELDPTARVRFSCESLKVTTRLLDAVAWLLARRAVDQGEIAAGEAPSTARRLGPAPEEDGEAAALMPERAQALIAASADLFRRVERLDRASASDSASPARALQERLARDL